jgi:hypothetical protein
MAVRNVIYARSGRFLPLHGTFDAQLGAFSTAIWPQIY